MSNFTCEICGTVILDGDDGYVTECEHYPIEATNLAAKSPMLFIADVLTGKYADTALGQEILRIFG